MVKSVTEWSERLSLLNGIVIPRQCKSMQVTIGTTEDILLIVDVRSEKVNFYIGLDTVTMRRHGTFTAKINGQIYTRKNISVTKSRSIMFTINRPTEETIELQEFTISDS